MCTNSSQDPDEVKALDKSRTNVPRRSVRSCNVLTGVLEAVRLELLRLTLGRFLGEAEGLRRALCRLSGDDGCVVVFVVGLDRVVGPGAVCSWEAEAPETGLVAEEDKGFLPNCFTGRDGSLLTRKGEARGRGLEEDTHSWALLIPH